MIGVTWLGQTADTCFAGGASPRTLSRRPDEAEPPLAELERKGIEQSGAATVPVEEARSQPLRPESSHTSTGAVTECRWYRRDSIPIVTL